MAVIDTIEGYLTDTLWYHYDATGDVLYLRLAANLQAETLGEETDDGLILLRDETTNAVVGLTIVNWWARFGQGQLPDSMKELASQIEPWGSRLAA